MLGGGTTRLLAGAITVLGGLAVPAGAAAGTPGCSLASTGGTVVKSLGARTYRVNVPAGLTADAPLLISMHGFSSGARAQETATRWTPFANARRFIVAYPQGRPTRDSGYWDWHAQASPDVRFVRDVAADIAARWCVDPRRIHLDGWSNGGLMAQRLACAAADRFASATSYGAASPTLGGLGTPCAPSRPIAVGLIAGQLDPAWLALEQNTAEWRALNGCAATPAQTTDAHGSTRTYACAAGTAVLSRTVRLTSHNWPGGAKGDDQRARIWAFLSAHPLP